MGVKNRRVARGGKNIIFKGGGEKISFSDQNIDPWQQPNWETFCVADTSINWFIYSCEALSFSLLNISHKVIYSCILYCIK